MLPKRGAHTRISGWSTVMSVVIVQAAHTLRNAHRIATVSNVAGPCLTETRLPAAGYSRSGWGTHIPQLCMFHLRPDRWSYAGSVRAMLEGGGG